MTCYILGAITQCLQGWSHVQCPLFNRAIICSRALFEFYMYTQYQSHDDAIFSYMEGTLCFIHTFKDDFLLWWACNQVKAKTNALRTELMKKWTVDENTNADTWTPYNQWCEMNTWWDYISHTIDVSKHLDAGCNFPKIHLMSYGVKQIYRYGALQQYSAKRHEQAHITNIKDGWNAANHTLNHLPQVITIEHFILCWEIWKLNLQALTQQLENSAATCKVFPYGADLAAPLSS